MKTFPTVKVAAVQAAPVMLDTAATVEKACRFIDEAGANGAKVIGFPEAFIPGYPWWIWMGNPDYGMEYYEELYKQAVEIPDESVRALSEAARRNEMYVCVSMTERERGSLYLTQLWFDPHGDLVGKHRKFKATSAEKTIWGDGDGSMAPVLDTEYGRLGGLQCWEHLLPLNVAAMSSFNEQIHVASWPIGYPDDNHPFGTPQCIVASQYYAITNACYVLESSMIWTEDQADRICKTDAERGMMKLGYGHTRVIGPNGVVISQVDTDVEGIAYADADLASTIPVKYLIDPSGHYSTPGFLQLTYDRSEHKPVHMVGEAPSHDLSYDEIQFGNLA